MRKVKFNIWVPAISIRNISPTGKILSSRIIEGTGCWEKDFPNEGIFHQWSNGHIALVELPDGTIEEILPSNIKFVEPAILP